MALHTIIIQYSHILISIILSKRYNLYFPIAARFGTSSPGTRLLPSLGAPALQIAGKSGSRDTELPNSSDHSSGKQKHRYEQSYLAKNAYLELFHCSTISIKGMIGLNKEKCQYIRIAAKVMQCALLMGYVLVSL